MFLIFSSFSFNLNIYEVKKQVYVELYFCMHRNIFVYTYSYMSIHTFFE